MNQFSEIYRAAIAIAIFSFLSAPPKVGAQEGNSSVAELFDSYVESAPSDVVGQPGEPDNTRKELCRELVSRGPETVTYLSQVLKSDAGVVKKGEALTILRNSGIGTETVLPIVRKYVSLEQEEESKALLSYSINYLVRHGDSSDLKKLEQLAEQGSGSLKFYAGNAVNSLKANLASRDDESLVEGSRPSESDAPPIPAASNSNGDSIAEETDLELLESPRQSRVWPFVLAALAILGIFVVLVRSG